MYSIHTNICIILSIDSHARMTKRLSIKILTFKTSRLTLSLFIENRRYIIKLLSLESHPFKADNKLLLESHHITDANGHY